MLDPSALCGYTVIPEPKLLFAKKNTDLHPLCGLVRNGPYSNDLGHPGQIRLAYIAPFEYMQKLDRIVNELQAIAEPKEAKNYYIRYEGFSKVFRIPLVSPQQHLRVETAAECKNLALSGNGDGLVDGIMQTLSRIYNLRREYDVVLLFLPREWKNCFEYEGFNLHDRIKAKVAPLNIPIQIINDTAIERNCRANVLWGLSIALFTKAGGIPWKLYDLNKDEAYIGLSYAIKKQHSTQEYTTCCSQIFDPDGTGFEFVAYDTKEFTTDRKGNPFLSYQEMQSLLSKSLYLYQNSHSGKIPKKLYVHKTTHFKEQEVQGALDSVGSKTEIELIQIVRHTNWYGLKLDRQNSRLSPSGYPLNRGLYLPLTESECLLWTQGSVDGVNQQRSHQPVFKEAALRPIPGPVMVRRFSGEGGWHETCSSIISLTKVDWNNNTLYKTIPVTLGYSQVFANVVKLNPDIVDNIYDCRFFM